MRLRRLQRIHGRTTSISFLQSDPTAISTAITPPWLLRVSQLGLRFKRSTLKRPGFDAASL